MNSTNSILIEDLTISIKFFNAISFAQSIYDTNMEGELISCALHKDELISSRAMWVLAHCSDIDYSRIVPYHDLLIKNLKKCDLHNGVIRNTLRLFQTHEVPVKQQSFLLDKCFEYIKNPSQAIAVRSFAITIVFNIAKQYPELLQELFLILNHLNISEESPGIKSKVKNTIKAINQTLKRQSA